MSQINVVVMILMIPVMMMTGEMDTVESSGKLRNEHMNDANDSGYDEDSE